MTRKKISSPVAGLMAITAMLVTSAPATAQGFGSRVAASADNARAEARADYQRRDRSSDRQRADRQRSDRTDRQRSERQRTERQRYERRGDDNRRSSNDRRWENNRRDNDRRWDNNRRDTDRRWESNRRDNDRRWDNNRRDNDRRWDNNRRWENDRRPSTGWSSNWRNNRSYDWRGYRDYNRDRYRMGRYYSPYNNYGYSRLRVGISINRGYYGSRYWINDPWSYRLPYAPRHMRWVRYYNDVVLVDMRTGRVRDVIYNFFW